jgi:hypothetical protein
MSDARLAELRRQRALVAEHLAWLDREIATHAAPAGSATVGGGTATAPDSLPAPPPLYVSPQAAPAAPVATYSAPSVPSPEAAAQADAILAEYSVSPGSVKSDVRKGCFLYFAAAFLLLGLGVGALWLAFRR